jgi:hypothetical protein
MKIKNIFITERVKFLCPTLNSLELPNESAGDWPSRSVYTFVRMAEVAAVAAARILPSSGKLLGSGGV